MGARVVGVLLAALLGIGCGSERPTYHGDTTFTAAEREAIERGNAWLAERVDDEPFAIVWDAPHPADDELGRPYDIVRRPKMLGGRNDERRVVHLGVGEGSPSLDVLAAHELGHARGLVHVDDEGVMDPEPWQLVWTESDRAMCFKTRACR